METEQLNTSLIFAERYRIVGLLGRGGVGDVFLARDTLIDNSLVALKVLFYERQKDKSIAERFVREIQATRMISHPNVVRTFDFGSHGKKMYFTMEYVEGVSLQDELDVARLSFDEAIGIFYQLCLGLIAIHEANIIHRDIKPSNIIIGKDGVPKYNDFGIAHLKGSNLTGSMDMLGTSYYIAPELFIDSTTTNAVDIYSLGVMAYQMFTHQMPYQFENDYQLAFVKNKGTISPLLEHCPELPIAINDLVLKMLKSDPKLRIESAKAVAGEIEEFAKSYYKDNFNETLLKPYSIKSVAIVETENPAAGLLLDNYNNLVTTNGNDDTIAKSFKEALSKVAKRISPIELDAHTKKKLRRSKFTLIVLITFILSWYVLLSETFREKLNSPAGITGLVAWYNTNSLKLRDGEPVKALFDSSLNKLNANQVEVNRQPIFKEKFAFGHPSIVFDGEDDFLEADDVALKLREANSVTLIYVAKVYDKKSQYYLFSGHLEDKVLNLFHVGFLDDNRVRIRTIKDPYPPGYHDSDPVIITGLAVYTVTLDQRNVSVFQNGKRLFIDQINDSIEFARSTYFSIGQEYDQKQPADFFKGELAEVLIYNRALDDQDRKKIERLLAEKYKLSLRE